MLIGKPTPHPTSTLMCRERASRRTATARRTRARAKTVAADAGPVCVCEDMLTLHELAVEAWASVYCNVAMAADRPAEIVNRLASVIGGCPRHSPMTCRVYLGHRGRHTSPAAKGAGGPSPAFATCSAADRAHYAVCVCAAKRT